MSNKMYLPIHVTAQPTCVSTARSLHGPKVLFGMMMVGAHSPFHRRIILTAAAAGRSIASSLGKTDSSCPQPCVGGPGQTGGTHDGNGTTGPRLVRRYEHRLVRRNDCRYGGTTRWYSGGSENSECMGQWDETWFRGGKTRGTWEHIYVSIHTNQRALAS